MNLSCVDVNCIFTSILLNSTGLTQTKRDEIQQEWMDGKVPIIVATISFGMGVDKASVR